MKERPEKIVAVGEALAAFISRDLTSLRLANNFQLSIAGAEFNTCVALARLGMRCHFVGRVGADPFGERIITSLRAENIDTTAVRIDTEAPTGLLIRSRRRVGQAEVSYRRDVSAGSRLSVADIEEAGIDTATIVHLSGITPALSESARHAAYRIAEITHPDRNLSLDINYRSKLWDRETAAEVLRPLTQMASVVFASEDEAALLLGLAPATPRSNIDTLAQRILSFGPDVAIIRSAHEVVAATPTETVAVTPNEITPVDAVGAGDAFDAGFLYARARGDSLAGAVALGNTMGCYAVGAVGDIENLPTEAELAATPTNVREPLR